MNLYDVLGLSPRATLEEIHKAYRKLAMRWHPDRNPGDEKAPEMFKRVQDAYDTLSDPNKKAVYDGQQSKHQTKHKPKDKKGKRPYSGDGFIYADAPPPKVDVWGEPILPEHEWVDAYSDHYESGGQPDIRNL